MWRGLERSTPTLPRTVYASDLPQVWQKRDAVGEYCPQAGQSIGAGGSTCCTGDCIRTTVGWSAVNDHTNATTQPTKVQPRRMFKAMIAPLFRLFHAINDGRK